MGIRDLTKSDLEKINQKLQDLGANIKLTPKLSRAVSEILPTGLKLELEPKLKQVSNEALAKAVEGKVMKVEVTPLLTHLRKALKDATVASPPEIEVGVQATKLRTLIESVLNKHGFMINISTVNDNYTKVVQQQLNGRTYKVVIHADAREISRSVQASLMQVQSRYFGLQVSKDILRNSIDQALMGKPFQIQIAVMHDQARRAVQNALNNARMVGKDDALAYQRLMSGELKAAQAELARLKAAHMGAADAAKAHASASINLGGAMGSNIKIAGELGSAMASLYSIHAAKEFLSQVVEIGGELEHQKIAMDTIFGDKGKTNELFGQIKGLARQSPFGVMELTSSVKQLSAYGVEYNEIYDTAKRLADISAATSVDIKRLILAFGKTKSRGFLDGLEAKQFAYANIPIYEMVRKKLEELEGQAVTTADVMARMKKREIGFDIVKDVLWDITDPGGKFYNMQEALAGSVKTSWKLVRDNIELMFGEMAESGIGSALKSTAELLQGLTRNWRSVGAVVAAAAIGLGLYRVTTLGVNSAIQKSTLATYSQIIAQKQKNAEELKAWGRIIQLDRAEKMRIATAGKLTNADLRQAIAAGKLTDKHIAQLFWQKKITAEQVKYLAGANLINPALTKAILSNNRFTLSLHMLSQGLTKAKLAMKAFLLNPWTVGMAAVSGLVSVWQHMGEQTDKAEEFGNTLSTKATEGARNLTEALKGLNGQFSDMNDIKLADTVGKLEQIIKDYGIFAEKTLFYSKVDDNGMVRTMEQRAEYLYRQAKILEEAYTKFKDWKFGDMASRASESTNGNFWTLNWYDGLQTDIEDYVEDVRNAQKELTNYLRDHEDEAKLVVKFAAEIDPEFGKLTNGMGVEQAMNALVADLDRLQAVYDKIPRTTTGRAKLGDVDMHNFINMTDQFLNNWTNTDVKHSQEEVLREMDTFMASLRKEILSKDKDFFKNLTDEKKVMLGIAFQETFRGMEGLDDQFIMPLLQRWNDYFGTAFDPFFIEGQIKSQFSSLIPDLGDDLAKKVRNGEKLNKAEEDKVKALFDKAVATVKHAWPGKAAEIQEIVDSRPIYANILLDVNQRSGMAPWQKQLDDAFSNNYEITAKIKGEADTQSTLKAIAELKKAAKESLGKFALSLNITPNLGNLSKMSTDGPLTALEKQQREEYNKLVDLLNDIAKGEQSLGINLDGWEKKKEQGSKKDTVAEQLKQRFKDIKDAYAMFKEWAKLEGNEAAFKRVGNSGLFATLAPDKVPKTVDEYLALIDELEKDLKAAGIKGHNQRETLANDLIKERFGINKDTFKEELQLALDKVSKEAERQLENWNLYDKVRKATGNKQLAFNLAFGIDGSGETDYVAMIKKQFGAVAKAADSALTFDTATPEKLAEAPEEVRKAWEKANSDILKYFDQQREKAADLLSEYQTLQDKITAIEGKRQRDLESLNATDKNGNLIYTDPNQRKRMASLINSAADWEIYRQGEDYMKFFSSIYSLALTDVRRIGDSIKLYLNEQFRQGKFNIKEYADEIAKVDEQTRKAENVRSDFLTRISSGRIGVIDKRIGKEQGEVLSADEYKDAIDKQLAAYNKLKQLKKDGYAESSNEYVLAKGIADEADKTLNALTAGVDRLYAQKEQLERISTIFSYISQQTRGLGDIFNDIKTISGAFGLNTDSSGFDTAEMLVTYLQGLSDGLVNFSQALDKNDYAGMAAAVSQIVATAAKSGEERHDRKRTRWIREAAGEYKRLQGVIDAVSRSMERFLGNGKWVMAPAIQQDYEALKKLQKGTVEYERTLKRVNAYSEGGAYAYQRALMEEQLDTLQAQYDAENDKKQKDDTVLQDYQNQMAELHDQILYFAEETAKDLYGIDIKGWASELGDAIFEAWKKGEDGAEAFRKKAGEIIGDVMNEILKIGILEPMMQNVQDYLFGKDGKSGAFGADFELSPDEVSTLAGKIMAGMEGVDAYTSALDQLEKVLQEKYGLSMKEDEGSKSGLTAGIQALTENTGDLLASYINGMRGDVSVQTHELWPRLLDTALPQISVIAQSQLDAQRQIAEYTRRNAEAAEAIVKSNNDISRLLARVTQGAAKFYVN